MADPTARIEATSTFREPDRNTSSRGSEKPRPKMKATDDLAELAAVDEQDEREKHSLDTLA